MISYAAWIYFRFPLNLRMAEEMLAAINVSHESVSPRRAIFPVNLVVPAIEIAHRLILFPSRLRILKTRHFSGVARAGYEAPLPIPWIVGDLLSEPLGPVELLRLLLQFDLRKLPRRACPLILIIVHV
jgi:hypothetical protein